MDDSTEHSVKEIAKYFNKSLYGIVKLCIETQDDYAFLERQLIIRKDSFFAVAALRDYKLATRKYSYDQFKSDYANNKRLALEKLFLHPVNNINVTTLNTAILYELHSQHPNKSLPRLLHLYKSKDFARREA